MHDVSTRTRLRAAKRLTVPFLFSVLAFGCQDGVDEGGSDLARDEAIQAACDEGQTDSPAKGDPLEVKVAEGVLKGKQAGTVRQFLGIPYAKAPVGELRFAAPQPAAKWDGVKEAVAHGPSCIQNQGALSAPGPQSEDCLSLNVYAPESGKKLPVMVWIHGGAFISGGSVQYDGTRLAGEGPVVVVSINYRLGALGFFSHPALDEARGDKASGNDALRDPQLALEWVKRNIDAFGGDKNNVTVFGESAGSMSTCLQMVAPGSEKLANRFILESGACVGGLPIGTKESANTLGVEFAKSFCADAADQLACLRTQDPAALVKFGADRGIFGAGWGPIAHAGDPTVPDLPAKLIAAGKYNKGGLILGSNKNEWGLFLRLQAAAINTVAAFNAAVDAQFGPAAAPIKAYYTTTDATATETFTRLMTDASFRCPTRALARLTSAQGVKTYLYSFEEGPALHAFEIPYVFGNPNANLGAPTLVEPLRATVQAYWRSFAVDGDPNVEGQPTWPAYTAAGDAHITLKAASAAGTKLSEADCNFWDRLTAAAPR
jgi:para-nitrobenzyl esterase